MIQTFIFADTKDTDDTVLWTHIGTNKYLMIVWHAWKYWSGTDVRNKNVLKRNVNCSTKHTLDNKAWPKSPPFRRRKFSKHFFFYFDRPTFAFWFICKLQWTSIVSSHGWRNRDNSLPETTTPQFHEDVIKWKHFPRYWSFVRGIHRSPANSLTKANDAEPWCFLWCAPE